MTLPIAAFGSFTLDAASGLLRGKDGDIRLGHRAAALLRALIEANGQPVTKSALLDAAWPGMVVEEGNLTVQIAALRKSLGMRPDGQDWIVTVPRVGYRLVRGDVAPVPELPALPVLAVLPFANLGGDPEQEYFADGVVEDIITALSRFRSFAVIARNSTFAYKGRAVDVRQLSADLGARYVLEGSVRRSGNQLRISARLVDGDTGAHIWAQNFDGAMGEIFEVQDRITANVAALVEPGIERAEIERAWRKPPGSLDAYDYYLQALQKHNTYLEPDNRVALQLLEKAIALEPGFAAALASAAYGYEHRVTMGWAPASTDDRARALELAHTALEHGSDDAMVLAHCGIVIQGMARDYDQGLRLLRRALDLNPNNVAVMFKAAAGHMWGGSLDDALDLMQRIIRVSPGDTQNAMTGVAHVLLCQGRYEEALPWAARSLAEHPNFDVAHWVLIAAYAHAGRLAEARQAVAALLERVPGATVSAIAKGHHTKDPARTQVLIDGLRLAGMPE